MVTPYTIHLPEARLAFIRARIKDYDWTQVPDTGGWKSGVGLSDLKRLVTYWDTTYDWRAVEAQLNQLPHFMATVEGEPIHFLHLRGDGSKPPLLLLHGWPGSFIEFEHLIEPLARDGHDIIVPSLPGFAFSNPITRVMGPRRAAEIMHGLMTQLFGQTRYIAQGGDWGSGITGWLAHDRPDALVGIHLNMADLVPHGITPTTAEEEAFVVRRDYLLDLETGYNHEQETRPQTLGVAMADSPVGAAAWILEKFGKWSDLPVNAQGDPDLWSVYTERQLLTNIMFYVGASAFVTATWMYHGKRLEGSGKFPAGTHIQVPTGIAAFKDPVFIAPPRSFAEKFFNVVHWTEMPRGGHFAAWEQPQLLLEDIRAFVATVAP